MPHSLTAELSWLTLTLLMTGLMWVPYTINRLLEQGVLQALKDPQGETGTRVAWAERMTRAHQNAVENLVIFAPLVLTLHAANTHSVLTVAMCMLYFFARAAHYVVFTLGIPWLRIPVFAVAVSAQMVLALVLLGLI